MLHWKKITIQTWLKNIHFVTTDCNLFPIFEKFTFFSAEFSPQKCSFFSSTQLQFNSKSVHSITLITKHIYKSEQSSHVSFTINFPFYVATILPNNWFKSRKPTEINYILIQNSALSLSMGLISESNCYRYRAHCRRPIASL